MKLYKLTTQDNRTCNDTFWGESVTHTASGIGELCTNGWIHAYEHPLVAVFMNPIHAGINNPKLWLCEGKEPILRDGELKCGVASLTTLKEIPLPKITSDQRVKNAILCAKEVCSDPRWNAWADKWLSGEDRTPEAAEAAEWAAEAEEWAAARAAAAAAMAAAAAAEWAELAAAEWAELAAEAAARAAARSAAARAAAAAAEWADKKFSLIKILEEVCG